MDRKTAAKIGGLESWRKNRAQKLIDAEAGGAATLKNNGRAYYVRMRAKQLDERRKRASGVKRRG